MAEDKKLEGFKGNSVEEEKKPIVKPKRKRIKAQRITGVRNNVVGFRYIDKNGNKVLKSLDANSWNGEGEQEFDLEDFMKLVTHK